MLLYFYSFKEIGGIMREIKITENEKGQRLDKFLLKYMNKAPRSFIYKMLRKKNIKLNGKKAQGGEMLDTGDSIKLFLREDTIMSFTEERYVKPVQRNFEIVYEDENILLCSKPVGILTHSDNKNNNDTLNDSILYYLYGKNEYDPKGAFVPSVCNRLDRNTSGIVTAGKRLSAVQELNRCFRERLIDKYYITVVKGVIKEKGTIEGRHIKSSDNFVRLSDKDGEGDRVITKYRPIADNGEYTLMEIKLETGKSHQIRASMQFMGAPIIGDTKYGDAVTNKYFKEKYGIESQLLHSYKLVFHTDENILSYLDGREFICPPSYKYCRIIRDLFGIDCKKHEKSPKMIKS